MSLPLSRSRTESSAPIPARVRDCAFHAVKAATIAFRVLVETVFRRGAKLLAPYGIRAEQVVAICQEQRAAKNVGQNLRQRVLQGGVQKLLRWQRLRKQGKVAGQRA